MARHVVNKFDLLRFFIVFKCFIVSLPYSLRLFSTARFAFYLEWLHKGFSQLVGYVRGGWALVFCLSIVFLLSVVFLIEK